LTQSWQYGFTLWLDGVGFDLPEHYYCDFNCDNKVDMADFYIFAGYWLEGNCSFVECQGVDLNQGRDVNFVDFALFSQEWLKGF